MITQHFRRSIAQVILWLLTTVGLFLSLWIIIPAPIFSLLILSVGAPEISPAIICLNLIAVVVNAIVYGWQYPKQSRRLFVNLGCIVLALCLSVSPLLQFSATQQRAESVITNSLGRDYLDRIPQSVKAQMRSQPFLLSTLWRGIASPQVRIDRHIPFAAADGTQLAMNIYRPAKVGKYPALVAIYGGAWQRGSADSDEEFNRYIAARGYVVWAVDYRHAPKYKFPAQIDDIRSAFAVIKAQAQSKETDLDRVAVIGRSAGAQLAMLAAYRGDVPIRAVVNYYGPVNLTAGYNDPPVPDPIDSRATLRDFLGGTPQDFPQLYRDASPLSAVKSGLPPTLLIYGGKDRIVESKYGKFLADTLAKLGNRSIFIEIPWADHAFDAVFTGVSNQLALYYTERFLAWALVSSV
jgi:acetyl esterase/lipase